MTSEIGSVINAKYERFQQAPGSPGNHPTSKFIVKSGYFTRKRPLEKWAGSRKPVLLALRQPLDQFAEGTPNLAEIRFNALSGDDDQIERAGPLTTFETESLAYQAFPAIADMGLADFFGNDKPQSRHNPPIGHAINDQHAITARAFLRKNSVEFVFFAEVHALGKRKILFRLHRIRLKFCRLLR